ncbi:uncharacterized protein LOC108680449 [Hyalella azteca]|uniref:Uncharacterized protein LOC108680449 n=1 Tax=Hyalella azteca TaxID=294128 RepID=A0A8B7PF53_HYAAZ|nr:uncharacterized protein LOC108680449 [Hyalella azteca]
MSSLKEALGRRALVQTHVSSSTPKSSGSSQRSSTSYWLSSSTSTDSSSDFNISRAATKLAFEICIEEDPEAWEGSGETAELRQVISDGQKPERKLCETPSVEDKSTGPLSPRQTTDLQAVSHGKAVLPYLGKDKTTVVNYRVSVDKRDAETVQSVSSFSPAVHKVQDLRQPTYSLWMLQPTIRKAWLTSTLTILYKFDCDESYLKGQVVSLVLITLNTLDRHYHRCRVDHTTAVTTSSIHYPRETSLGSLGGDVDTVDEGGDRSPTAGIGAPAAGDETTPLPPSEGSRGDAPELVLTQVLSPEEGETYAPVVATIVTGQDGCAKVQLNASFSEEAQEDSAPEDIWYDADCLKTLPDEGELKAETCSTEDVQFAVAKEISAPTPHVRDSSTAVTSVMASQIQAFDDSFTVKIHNAELADDDDSGLQRLSEQALQGLRRETPGDGDETMSSLKEALGRRALVQTHVSSSTPKSSGSSQRSSTSYWLSSSTSTDSSSDFNISRAATKLAFEICIEEDSEAWEASGESNNICGQ